MKHNEGEFIGVKDTKIYYQCWLPDSAPKAIIQLVHGFGEHAGRYGNLVNVVVPKGYAVYADDHRGHGKSGGLQNYVDCFCQFVDDEKSMFDIIKKAHPNVPIFMLGHSLGSAIGVEFAKKYESLIKGLILSGSGTKLGGNISGFLIMMAKILSKLAPKMAVASGGLGQFLSHDPAVIKAYEEDPLVHADKATTRLGAEMMKTFAGMPNSVGSLTLPLLYLKGTGDKLVVDWDPMIAALKMNDKTVKLYPDLYHELFNEPEVDRAKVMADLLDWLNKHV